MCRGAIFLPRAYTGMPDHYPAVYSIPSACLKQLRTLSRFSAFSPLLGAKRGLSIYTLNGRSYGRWKKRLQVFRAISGQPPMMMLMLFAATTRCQ